MKIGLFFNIILCSIPIIAHPFYKTMPLEYERIYQELKYLEKLIINIAKKDYPKIPETDWNQFYNLEKTIQNNLSLNGRSIKSIQKPRDIRLLLEEAKTYCHDYFIYECNRLGINQNKINLNFESLPKNTAGWAKGPHLTHNLNHMSAIDLLSSLWYKADLKILIDKNEQPKICIDLDKHYNNISFIEITILHELIHTCEGHHLKSQLLYLLIHHHYGEHVLKSTYFKELETYYYKTQELQATIIPALLEHNYHLTLAEITPIDYKSRTNIHPDGDVIHFWLQKIDNAGPNQFSTKNNCLSSFLKKLYTLLSFLKKK